MITLDEHIDELRPELRCCLTRRERAVVKAELKAAIATLKEPDGAASMTIGAFAPLFWPRQHAFSRTQRSARKLPPLAEHFAPRETEGHDRKSDV
jgi:hypothetical protein